MTVDARDLGNGIGLIRLPLPFPALKWTNAYVIQSGGETTLIDCGVDSDETWDALQSGLAVLGLGIGELTTVISTHLHPDHMGMAHRVVQDAGSRFVMHDSAKAWLHEYNDWSIDLERIRTLAAASGAPDDEVAALSMAAPRPEWAGVAIEATNPVKDGELIPVGGGRTLRVLHTPGHEGAHICLVDSVTEALFSGDHILPRITPVIMHHPDGDRLGTYLESLRKIEEMNFGLTYPAHVSVLERGSLRARQIALHHERRLGAMLQELRRGPTTPWSVVCAIFRPNLNTLEKRLALSETVSHLEYLRIRAEAERSIEDGVWYYRLPARRW